MLDQNHTIIGFSLPINWYSVLYIFGAVIVDLVPATEIKKMILESSQVSVSSVDIPLNVSRA